jgi:hypothetical protein
MTTINLTTRDINVLEKIKDPESDPMMGVIIDSSMPRDPNVTDAALYDKIVDQERSIIKTIQALESELSQSQSLDSDEVAARGYRDCIEKLDDLIREHPTYASARNNRVQALRRLYGDAMLLNITSLVPMPLVEQPESEEKKLAAAKALEDMELSIRLLSPPTSRGPVSPQVARTLSMAHTQRAAVYLKTSKLLSDRSLDIADERPESKWSRVEFEEAASHDLALGGRYGNEIAKGLAVSVNPTAKLCGEMVREAMKKEYGPAYSGQ